MWIMAVRAGALDLSRAVGFRRVILFPMTNRTELCWRQTQDALVFRFMIVVARHAIIEVHRAVQELRVGHHLRVTTRETEPPLRCLDDEPQIPFVTRLAISIFVRSVNMRLSRLGLSEGGNREKTSQNDRSAEPEAVSITPPAPTHPPGSPCGHGLTPVHCFDPDRSFASDGNPSCKTRPSRSSRI